MVPADWGSASCSGDDRATSPSTRASSTPRPAPRRSPTSTATRASCATAATRSSSSRRSRRRSSRSSYLLIYGELPTPTQLERASAAEIREHTMLHEDLSEFFDGFPRDAHPMAGAVLGRQRAVDLLPGQPRPVRRTSTSSCRPIRLLAKLPTIAAYAYKKSIGQPFLYPDNSLGYVENFLRMTFGVPAEPYEVDPVDGQGARHAVHPARRPRAELLDLDGAAGRLGARQPVRLGLRRRQRAVRPAARRRQPGGARDARARSTPTAATSTAFVKRVKNKEPGVKLMGFGHRVYKNYDPRAAIVKKADPRGARRARHARPAARHRDAARGDRAGRRLLHRAQALPERRLLHRRHLQGDGLPDARCSRCCSRSAGCPAGSPSGAR